MVVGWVGIVKCQERVNKGRQTGVVAPDRRLRSGQSDIDVRVTRNEQSGFRL